MSTLPAMAAAPLLSLGTPRAERCCVLCGTGLARLRGRRWSAGAQEQPVLKKTEILVAVKSHLDMHHHHRYVEVEVCSKP